MLGSYIERGIERTLIDKLESEGIVVLAGLPGVGKSTTARKIAIMLLEEKKYVPLIIKPAVKPSAEAEEASFGFEDFADNKEVPYIELPTYIDDDKLKDIVSTMCLFAKQLESDANFFEKLWSRLLLKFKESSKKEYLKIVSELLDDSKTLLDRVKEFLHVDSLMDGIKKYLNNEAIIGFLTTAITLGQPYLQALLIASSAISVMGVGSRIFKKHVNIKPEKLVLIVDGISKSKSGGYSLEQFTLDKFLFMMKTVKTMYVVRVDFEMWYEYLCNKVGRLGYADIEKQVVDLVTPEWDVFRDIVRANRGEVDEATIYRLYEITNIPTLALTVYDRREEFLNSVLKKLEGAKWPSSNKIEKVRLELKDEKDDKRIEELNKELNKELNNFTEMVIKNTYKTTKLIYEDLRKENFSYVALIAQPMGVAEDELKEFCERTRDYWESRALKCGWVLEDYMIRKEKVEQVGGERTIYFFNEHGAHLPPLVKTLVMVDKDENIVREDIALARRMLLEIMDKEFERLGYISPNMIRSALEHVSELSCFQVDRDWLAQQALEWGSLALGVIPLEGLRFLQTKVLQSLFIESIEALRFLQTNLPEWLFDESKTTYPFTLLLAAEYARKLAKTWGWGSMPSGNLMDICEYMLKPSCNDLAVIALRAWAYANMAEARARGGDKEGMFMYGNRARDLLDILKNQHEKLYNLTRARVTITLGEALLNFVLNLETVEGFIKDAFEELKDIEQRLDAYASDEHVKRLLRLFGGDVTWTLKRDIIEMRIRNSFSLAKILRNRGDLEGAGEYFKTCWQMNRELGLLIGELSSWLLYVSVAVLKDGVQNAKVKTLEGEELSALDHFKRIWEIICEQPSRMTAELYVNVLSDYVLANLIINKKYPNDYNEEKFKMGGIHPPLLGLAYLVERANDLPHRCAKEEALKEPRELERQRPNTSVESVFSYILDFIINDDFDNASLHAEVAAKQRGPSTMIARLFSELAEATKARKLDEVLDKLTRLFYYHFAWNLG